MPLLLRFLLGIALLAILGFAIFGFAATFEPGAGAMTWRWVYSGAGLACIVGLVLLARIRSNPRRT